MAAVWNIISGILSLEPVQGAIVAIIVALITKAIVKYRWLKKAILIFADAYDYAEEQGLLKGLKGYQKWDPFFDKLIAGFRETFGREPTPEERAEAVKYVEKRVIDEKKRDGL